MDSMSVINLVALWIGYLVLFAISLGVAMIFAWSLVLWVAWPLYVSVRLILLHSYDIADKAKSKPFWRLRFIWWWITSDTLSMNSSLAFERYTISTGTLFVRFIKHENN